MNKSREPAFRLMSVTVKRAALVLFGILLGCVIAEAMLGISALIFKLPQHAGNLRSLTSRSDLTVLCLGESTTAWGGDMSYPRQLEEMLNDTDGERRYSVINAGITGASTTDILRNLTNNLDRYSPDIVIVMMGINDEGHELVRLTDLPKDTTFTPRTLKLLCYAWRSMVQRLSGGNGTDAVDRHFSEVSDSSPATDTPDSLSQAGMALKKRGRIKEAEELFAKALRLSPCHYDALTGMGACLKHSGKPRKAEECFVRATAIAPARHEALCELGDMYLYSGKTPEAEKCFEQVLTIHPENYQALVETAHIRIKTGQYREAVDLLKRAYEINPENYLAPARLAACYGELDEPGSRNTWRERADRLLLKRYNPVTRGNYRQLCNIVSKNGIYLICAQYPLMDAEPLRRLLEGIDKPVIVENRSVFREALKKHSVSDIFTDLFGGEFGHCTPLGNRILAQNVAQSILGIVSSEAAQRCAQRAHTTL